MQPTMKLRWLRVVGVAKSDPDIKNYYHESMVLQQLWEDENAPIGQKEEWRDIEIAEE